jgi:molybdopterin-guanine dinucleotide biosynthesis protein A
MIMDAILLAGGYIPHDDPFFEYTGDQPKALLPIINKPMISWVLDALDQANTIGAIHVIGLTRQSNLSSQKPLSFTEDQGGLLENVKAGFNQVQSRDPKATHAVITSSDIPLITGEIIDWRVNSAMDQLRDYDFAVVDRRVMEKRFPGSNRSYLRVDGVQICAADINVFRIQVIDDEMFWRQIISLRKSPLAQARFIGLSVLLRILTRRFTLKSAEGIVHNRLGLDGRIRFSPYAEVAMDIDKPHQYELIIRELQTS